MSKTDPFGIPPRDYKRFCLGGKDKKGKGFPYSRKPEPKHVVGYIIINATYTNPERKKRKEEKKKNIEKKVENE